MTALGIGRDARRRLSAPRIAEIVADELRRQIINGELADGDLLPRQEVLVEQFNVSLVSLREALRILETEGLVSVRRGNRGGAVVHAPAKTSAAYMLGLLLQSESVAVADLGMALQELEPACAALAAQRPDRADTLVPELKQVNESMAENLEDGRLFTEIGREFHDLVVRGCGNHTIIAVVGSLETLWTSHEQQWADESAARGTYPSLANAARCSTRTSSWPRPSRRATSTGRAASRVAISPTRRPTCWPVGPTNGSTRCRRRRCRARGISGNSEGAAASLRTALVTGGSGGIGKGCGRKLVELGYDVVLSARREAPVARGRRGDRCAPHRGRCVGSGRIRRCDKRIGDDRPRGARGRHAGRDLRAQADVRAVADHHLGQPGFVLRGDRRRAAEDARRLAARVHLVVGGARADDGPDRLLGVEGRHERVRPRLGARSRPGRHQPCTS